MDNCNFTDNSASYGGAIEFWKSGTVEKSNFVNNFANSSGGAIYSNDIKVIGSNFADNSADENSGGAVYASGIAEFNNSNFINKFV